MKTASAMRTMEHVETRIAKGHRVPLKGILKAQPTIEEISFLSALPTSGGDGQGASSCRAFRVHGSGLARDGLIDGDHLILREMPTPRPGSIVLAEIEGRNVLRRIQQRSNGVLFLAPLCDSLPFGEELADARILGAFAGVLRRRGFASPKLIRQPAAASQPVRAPTESALTLTGANVPQSKIRLLRGRLGSLESTYAATTNPRLRGALRNEAKRVRLLLQNEATKA